MESTQGARDSRHRHSRVRPVHAQRDGQDGQVGQSQPLLVVIRRQHLRACLAPTSQLAVVRQQKPACVGHTRGPDVLPSSKLVWVSFFALQPTALTYLQCSCECSCESYAKSFICCGHNLTTDSCRAIGRGLRVTRACTWRPSQMAWNGSVLVRAATSSNACQMQSHACYKLCTEVHMKDKLTSPTHQNSASFLYKAEHTYCLPMSSPRLLPMSSP